MNLDRIKTQILQYVKEFDNPYLQELYQQISYGKMLRSQLIIAIAGESEESVKLCAIVELIQLASLLHDDVIDESKMRRGKPSLNVNYGNKNAIMLGDALYAKAFYHLCDFEVKIAKSLSNAVCLLSSGEILDVFLSKSFCSSLEYYYQMIEEKTASLIASSAECASILCGLDSKKYYEYGRCLGIAFQIIDDLLDITQDQEVLGKPAMSDFKEGKTTLPYLFLYAKLPEDQKPKLLSMHKQELQAEQKQWIYQQMQQYDIFNLVGQEARKYASKALEALQTEVQPKLKEIVESMIQRSF